MNFTFNHGLYILRQLSEKRFRSLSLSENLSQNMGFIMQNRKKKAQTMEQSPYVILLYIAN